MLKLMTKNDTETTHLTINTEAARESITDSNDIKGVTLFVL